MSPPRLHFEVHDGDGPPLLLVHGILSSRAQWGPNLPALSAVARPVVVELWGHGRSPTPEEGEHYRPAGYVAAFERLRKELGVSRWSLCGQSFGAALTLRYALDHPRRVYAQIFTNSSSALADEAWMVAVRRGLEERTRALEAGGGKALEQIPVHPKNARRLPPEAKRAIVEDAELLDARGVARNLRFTTPDSSVREHIAGNRVPSLLVCGEQEERFEASRRFAEANMPRLEVVCAAAGHAVNLEAAETFNAAAVEFLRRHARA